MKSNTIIKTINQTCTDHTLLPENSITILGLSGGPDSVFLLHYLAQQKNITVIAAHLDHEWRQDSYKDIQFCQELAQQLNVKLVHKKFSDLSLSLKFNGSKEEVGRKARRYFLEQVRTEYNANFIALAHHAQDQQETFFIRLVRGASLTGLTAMKYKDDVYIRPLLDVNKSDILDYLQEQNIPYLIDPSNDSDIFLRNRIRKDLIPVLQKIDTRFNQNCAMMLKRLQETEDFLQDLTAKTFTTIAEKNGHWQINIPAFLAEHSVLQYRLLVYWLCQEKVPFIPTQSFFDEIIRFLRSSKSKEHVMHEKWKLVKDKDIVYISRTIGERQIYFP